MLAGDLVLGPVTGTYYSLFQKEISKIPTVTPSQNHRISRHTFSFTKYKSVIKMATTGRQPVQFTMQNRGTFCLERCFNTERLKGFFVHENLKK